MPFLLRCHILPRPAREIKPFDGANASFFAKHDISKRQNHKSPDKNVSQMTQIFISYEILSASFADSPFLAKRRTGEMPIVV